MARRLNRSGLLRSPTAILDAQHHNSARTADHVSEEQYELYSKLERELSAQLPDRDDPTYGKAFLTFTRSPAGVLANAYAARMIEWENKERDEHWVP